MLKEYSFAAAALVLMPRQGARGGTAWNARLSLAHV